MPRGRRRQPIGAVPRKRILVVEDHKEVRALAQSLLEDLGHEAIVAANAECGARRAAQRHADRPAVLRRRAGRSDRRPKLAEFARRLRPGLKVLMTSGYPDLVQARDSGCR